MSLLHQRLHVVDAHTCLHGTAKAAWGWEMKKWKAAGAVSKNAQVAKLGTQIYL